MPLNTSIKRAMICGISGQDGAYLAQHLINHGYEVYGTTRCLAKDTTQSLKSAGLFSKIKMLEMSILDRKSVLAAVKKASPTEIYNLCGPSSVASSFKDPAESIESIALGTLYLLEAIRELNPEIRIYNAGSSECFGETAVLAACESTPFNPKSPYAIAKATAFWEIKSFRESYGIFACTGILFNHESPLRTERFVTGKIISAAKRIAAGSQERLLLGNIDIVRDWGWAPEYVTAMHLMMTQNKPDDYLIATGESNSLRDFICFSFEKFGLDWNEHIDIDQSLLRPNDLRISKGNPEKAKIILGWQARYKMRDVIDLMIKQDINLISG
jgi:GDPmannose 4,6-dehydratase